MRPRMWDLGSWDLGLWDPRTETLRLGPSDPWVLGHGSLTLVTLEMGSWDPETSN